MLYFKPFMHILSNKSEQHLIVSFQQKWSLILFKKRHFGHFCVKLNSAHFKRDRHLTRREQNIKHVVKNVSWQWAGHQFPQMSFCSFSGPGLIFQVKFPRIYDDRSCSPFQVLDSTLAQYGSVESCEQGKYYAHVMLLRLLNPTSLLLVPT